MSNKVRYNGDANRGLSPALWGDPDAWRSHQDLGKCIFFWDDFLGWGGHTVNTNATINSQSGSWQVLADAGVTLNPAANSIAYSEDAMAALVASGLDADNDEVLICRPYQFAKFDYTSNIKVAYECRFKVLTVNTGAAFAAGLALRSDVAADFLAADTTDLVATANFVGFHTLDAAGTAIRTEYQNVSQAKQTVNATAGTLASNTYIKLGLVYEPNAADGKCVKFFVNGVEDASFATYANISNATLFPDGKAFVPFFTYKIDGTADVNAHLDWIACGAYWPR